MSHAERRVDLNDHDRAIMARLADYVAEQNPDPELEARLRALAT